MNPVRSLGQKNFTKIFLHRITGLLMVVELSEIDYLGHIKTDF
jgi:hypothetical protein